MSGGGKSNSPQAGAFSWDNGSFAKNSNFTPETLNKGIGADIQASYLQGPTQSSYVGLGDTTKGGITNLLNAANGNAGILNDAYGYTQGLIGSGGLTSGQNDNIATIGSIGGQYGDIAAGATDPSLTEQQLLNVAQGGAFGQDAPGYATLRANAIDDARTAINRQFANSGRFGSSLHNEDLGRGIFDAAAGLDYANYQNDIARQERALSSIEGQRQQGLLNQMNAMAGQMGTAQSGFSMGQQGIANAMGASDRAGEYYQNMLLPGQTQMQAGSILDADARGEAQFDPNYQHIAKYLALSGQQGQGAQPEQQPGFMDWLGLGIAGLGAVAPALPSLFALSDERAKEDIEKIGKTSDGLNIYKYHYKGSPRTEIGLLAQEVQKKKPEAVAMGQDGLLRVNYETALAS